MSKIITYLCPNCNGQILHDAEVQTTDEAYEICGMCGSKVFIKDLETKPSYAAAVNPTPSYVGVSDEDAMVTYIDGAESALAYLENFYENYDWKDFCNTASLSIPSVERMVDKILIKSAANPATWELQFTSIATPLCKKINGLKELEDKFLAEYVKNDDLTDSFVYYDLYAKIVNSIYARSSEILKKLNSAIKYYKKYNGSAAVLTQLNAQLDAISASLKTFRPIKDYKELSGFAKASEEKQNKVVQNLAARSINAEAVYAEAVEEYNSGKNLRHALTSFKTILGYKDAYEYVLKIDDWFQLSFADSVFIKLGKKYYIVRKKVVAAPTFSVSNPNAGGAAQTEPSQAVYDMYAIQDAKQVKTPCVSDITKILAHFGGNLVYIKTDNSVCVFNSEATAETAETSIITATAGEIEFLKDGDGRLLMAENKLFLRKKLVAVQEEQTKKGCFNLFKKNKAPVLKVVNNNNFSLATLNLANNKLETVIPEMVDIQEMFGNEIFFNRMVKDKGVDKEEYLAYNYSTKELRHVLSKDTEIVGVVNGSVIYFIWTPNDYNKDLYAQDLTTRVTTLLAPNVYDYYGDIDGRVYYYVGNASRKTLYSVNTDGSGKKEIRNNAKYFNRAVLIRNGWIYLTVGKSGSLNSALVKLSCDGERYKVLCPHFKSLVQLKDGYIYYIDVSDNLCIVREDGSEYKLIIDSLEGFVKIMSNGIYLLRKEIVDEENGNLVYSNSLYKVDFEGAGLTKVAFNVVSAAVGSNSKDEIYLYKVTRRMYSVSTPIDKDNYNVATEVREVKTISLFNINDATFTDIAVFGTLDEAQSYTFKAGCLKKPITKTAEIKEIHNKKTYQRKDKLQAGAVADEQLKNN